jgi:hypothetical protein|tara:strand:+ start:4071 stop:4340 length:270 start_codon:yes stop_codon:yes gene_type:complete
MSAYWYPFLGWSVFWISFILAIILFAIYKKIYPVFYMISMALYIFTAGFMVDVFDFGKLGILTVLVISSMVFMALGYYLSKVLNLEHKK